MNTEENEHIKGQSAEPSEENACENACASAEKAGKESKKDKKPSHADVAALSAAAEKAKKEAETAKETLLRTAAEYENYRKRSAKEKDGAFSDGLSHAVNLLLPVIDTLTLAAGAPTQDEEYKKGVTMTLQKCDEVFKALGVTEIDALDLPFDPQGGEHRMLDPESRDQQAVDDEVELAQAEEGEGIGGEDQVGLAGEAEDRGD